MVKLFVELDGFMISKKEDFTFDDCGIVVSFVEGSVIEEELFNIFDMDNNNFCDYLDFINNLDEEEKIRKLIAYKHYNIPLNVDLVKLEIIKPSQALVNDKYLELSGEKFYYRELKDNIIQVEEK